MKTILRILLMLAGYVVFEKIQVAYGNASPAKVNCGCHPADSCAQCGTEAMCHGDCVWKGNKCVSKNGDGEIAAFVSCTPKPFCPFTGCDKGCCLGHICCDICPKIINPPIEFPCSTACSTPTHCRASYCPYCFIPEGQKSGQCYGESGLRDQIQLEVESEIANLTSSNLAEFQSSNSKCSWWSCGFKVLRALHYCYKKCRGTKDCILPCMKKVLNAARKCWPCIKKGCCKLGFPCCDLETEEFIELPDGSYDLAVIGGNNRVGLLNSPVLVTSSGVCDLSIPKTIPALPIKTTAGGLAWMKSDNTTGTLVFCGGSQTFVPENQTKPNYPISNYGATNLCFSLKPGDSQWSSVGLCPSNKCGPNHQNDMDELRSWFSLTAVNDNSGEMFAVGGINDDGIISKTIEKYSVAEHTWKPFKSSLANPRFGHCAVHYSSGGNSYLILIGGSGKVPTGSEWYPTTTVEKIDLETGIISTLNDLPIGLWSPACTVSNGFIYVAGGSTGSRKEAKAGVYRYSFSTKTWSTSPIGYLNNPRWGAVMGTTYDGQHGALVVAGGYDPTSTYYNTVERSNDGGHMWKIGEPGLNEEREYASVVAVEPGTFTC